MALTRVFASLGVVALLGACAAGPAPEPIGLPPSAADGFSMVDTNADDHVDVAEWEAHGDKTFEQLDRDGSGTLTPDELNDGYDAFDANGDGVLSRDEVEAASLDLNGDGNVTRDEWRIAAPTSVLDSNGDGKIDREEFRARRSLNFRNADGNTDRRVSRLELSANAPGFTLFRF